MPAAGHLPGGRAADPHGGRGTGPAPGIVTTFCVVGVGYPGQRVTPPYVAAAVLLDGADIAFRHLVPEL